MTDGNRFKIGKSKNLKERYITQKTSNPDLILLGYTDKSSEKEMHEKYKKYHYKLEWYEFNDGDIISEVINDFRNVDTDFVITYYKKYNIIKEESTGKFVSNFTKLSS